MVLPVLIDEVQKNEVWTSCSEEIEGKWYTARPLGTRWGFLKRLYHAWLVLTGRADAFQYMADRKEMRK